MRVLIDLTNSPHVPFFAPLIALLQEDGHEVVVTAREFAQTIELAANFGIDVTPIGRHGGTSRIGKAAAAISRLRQLNRFVRKNMKQHGRFDAAISHGSTDLPQVARRHRIPHVTVFDYEWASTMHKLNCAASWRVVVPDSIPLDRLDAYRAAGKISTYPGIKEEYYLDNAALSPQQIRAEFNADAKSILVVLRPPADMALYHRGIHNDVFAAILERAMTNTHCVTVVLPRTDQQRKELVEKVAGAANVHIPETAVDGASLVAAADLVVSAGGTMNREACALGTPVYTVFAGKIGGVDEHLLAEGRLNQIVSADDVVFARRRDHARDGNFLVRDRAPRIMLDTLLSGLPVLDRRGPR